MFTNFLKILHSLLRGELVLCLTLLCCNSVSASLFVVLLAMLMISLFIAFSYQSCINNKQFSDLCHRHFLSSKLAWSSIASTGKHERRVQNLGCWVVAQYLETGLFLQKRKERNFPWNDDTKPLSMAVSW